MKIMEERERIKLNVKEHTNKKLNKNLRKAYIIQITMEGNMSEEVRTKNEMKQKKKG